MAQFDLYKNLNIKTKNDIPYLLDIQANLFSSLATRVVIPLYASHKFGEAAKKLNPKFEIKGKTYILSTAELAGVSLKQLGASCGSLESHRNEIIGAIDFLFTSI